MYYRGTATMWASGNVAVCCSGLPGEREDCQEHKEKWGAMQDMDKTRENNLCTFSAKRHGN